MYSRPALKDYDIFFFDCETGGLDHRDHDLVQVAAIRTDPTGTTVLDEYEAKVLPKKPVDPKAAAVNGYSPERWAKEGAVELDTPLVKLLQMGRNAIFTAHMASFDWGFFEAAFKARGARWQSDYHKWDTVQMAMPLLYAGLVPNVKLTTLSAYFGIEHANAHDALSDVRACQQVFCRLRPIYMHEAVIEQIKQAAVRTNGVS